MNKTLGSNSYKKYLIFNQSFKKDNEDRHEQQFLLQKKLLIEELA